MYYNYFKKSKISSISPNNKKINKEKYKTVQKRNKYYDESELMHFLQKLGTTSPRSTNMVFVIGILWIKANKIVDFILNNKRTYD